MPSYTYECTSCQDKFDAVHSFTENPHTVCKKCGGVLVKIIDTPPVFTLKGGGWYADGYSKKE